MLIITRENECVSCVR